MGCAHHKHANSRQVLTSARNPKSFDHNAPPSKTAGSMPPLSAREAPAAGPVNAQTGDAAARRLLAFRNEFRYFDQNQDGAITQDDVAECLIQFGIDALSVQAPVGQAPIREAQYIEWRRRVLETPDFLSNLENVFCFSDGDYDGAISKEDLSTLTALWTPAPSSETIGHMLRQVDWKGKRELDGINFNRMMAGDTVDTAPHSPEVDEWMARWRCLNLLYLPGYFS
jgi:Ca2+-binding EF-hand superfamily protein